MKLRISCQNLGLFYSNFIPNATSCAVLPLHPGIFIDDKTTTGKSTLNSEPEINFSKWAKFLTGLLDWNALW